jgi:hypothetical protein
VSVARPSHRHRASGAAVYPEGYDSADLEPLPKNYWRDRDRADALIALRAERDRRLAATDWTQTRDQDAAVAAKWMPYRRALRDLPDVADPLAPVWPEPPK